MHNNYTLHTPSG